MSEYNAKDDGEGSYLAAIEAKRLRGDTHYPQRIDVDAIPAEQDGNGRGEPNSAGHGA